MKPVADRTASSGVRSCRSPAVEDAPCRVATAHRSRTVKRGAQPPPSRSCPCSPGSPRRGRASSPSDRSSNCTLAYIGPPAPRDTPRRRARPSTGLGRDTAPPAVGPAAARARSPTRARTSHCSTGSPTTPRPTFGAGATTATTSPRTPARTRPGSPRIRRAVAVAGSVAAGDQVPRRRERSGTRHDRRRTPRRRRLSRACRPT